MAPKRSTSSSQSSKSSSSKKNKKSSSLQQSTLSFSLGKGASSQKKGGAKKSSSFSASSKPVEEVEISSDDDGEEEPREHKPEEVDDLELRLQDEEELEQEKVEVKELNVKGKEWTTGYIDAKRMMGKVEPIHAEEQTKVDTILRIFDLDFRYGPCTSLSRMDRWNRAERLGLEPPSYVKDILLTRQGKEDPKLKESVFYGAV